MGVSYGAVGVNVNFSGSVAIQGGTPTVVSGGQAGAGDWASNTVPAGKKWRIISAHVTAGVAAAAGGLCSIQVNGVAIVSTFITGLAASTAHGNNALSWDYSSCPIATAGQVVKGNNSAAGFNGYGGYTYIEEAA